MYENLIDPQIQILERCQTGWEAMMPSLPDDLSPYGIPSLTKFDIKKSFPKIISRLKNIKGQSLEEVSPFIVQTISQNFPSWTSPLESWISSAPSTLPNIVSHLNAMWSQLNTFDNETNIPNLEEVKMLVMENKRLQSEAKDLLKLTSNLTKKNNDLTEVLAQAKKFSKDSKELLEEALKSKATIDSDALVTLAHRESIVKDQIDSANQLIALNAITEKIPEFEQKRDAITKQCDEILVEAKKRLKAASEAGMAASFEKRTKEYVWPKAGWFIAFLFSLAGVFITAYCLIIPELKELKLEGGDRFFHLVTEIPLTLPFVWLAWFAALRFSQLGRLREDYAFKVATAMSLDGYRKQADDVSKELQEKLLDLAITNFGENPLRLMTKESAKDAHPFAGILDDKTIVELFRKRLKAVFGGKPE
jgi:hypothetical protein